MPATWAGKNASSSLRTSWSPTFLTCRRPVATRGQTRIREKKMPIEEKSAIKVSRRFDASAERVFDAWLEPTTARKWLYATDDSEIVRCDLDARVGGSWTIVRRGP